MATYQSPSNRTMEIDSTFSLNISGSIKFSQEGLYFVQADTSSAQGLGFRVTDNYFPKLAKIQDLVNSLRYFSTRNEWDKLNASENSKKEFDDYWMKVTKSEQKARRIIKQYFDQVMLANNYFTNYKEGWKTDKGMIFIIFGNPDEVYRNKEGELWIYKKDDNFQKMRFSFAKVPNIFTDNQYTLLRSNSYQNNWFKAVQLWRRGTL
jgi:GWxTD domain-containing protein